LRDAPMTATIQGQKNGFSDSAGKELWSADMMDAVGLSRVLN